MLVSKRGAKMTESQQRAWRCRRGWQEGGREKAVGDEDDSKFDCPLHSIHSLEIVCENLLPLPSREKATSAPTVKANTSALAAAGECKFQTHTPHFADCHPTTEARLESPDCLALLLVFEISRLFPSFHLPCLQLQRKREYNRIQSTEIHH